MNKLISKTVIYRGTEVSVNLLKENSNIKVIVECLHGQREVRWNRRHQLCRKCVAEAGLYNTSPKGREITWGDKISDAKKGALSSEEHKKALSMAHTGVKLSAEHIEAQNNGKMKLWCKTFNKTEEDWNERREQLKVEKEKYGIGLFRSRYEEICREIFESTFNKSFPSVRPDFLKNPDTGCNLELDGYCEELKLAFEYDGEQHYREVDDWSKCSLEDIKKRDCLKNDLCKQNDIILIRIPYWENKQLSSYIKDQLDKIIGSQNEQ